jgi:hypothetical protein
MSGTGYAQEKKFTVLQGIPAEAMQTEEMAQVEGRGNFYNAAFYSNGWYQALIGFHGGIGQNLNKVQTGIDQATYFLKLLRQGAPVRPSIPS